MKASGLLLLTTSLTLFLSGINGTKKAFLFMKRTDTNILQLDTVLRKEQRLNDLVIDTNGPVSFRSPQDLDRIEFLNINPGSDRFKIKTLEKSFTRERTNFLLYR